MPRYLLLVLFLYSAAAFADNYKKDLAEAVKLDKAGKAEEAIAAYIKLAEKSEYRDRNYNCLRNAALLYNKQENYEKAIETAGKIKNKPLSKACQMEIMLLRKKYQVLIDTFKDEDIMLWPENCAGKGFARRGRAYSKLNDFKKAAEDTYSASQYSSTYNEKAEALYSTAQIYLNKIKDLDKAEMLYKKLAEEGPYFQWTTRAGISTYTSLMIKKKDYESADKLLNRYPVNTSSGNYWSGTLLESKAKLLKAEGKFKEALDLYTLISNLKTMPQSIVKRSNIQIEILKVAIKEKPVEKEEVKEKAKVF